MKCLACSAVVLIFLLWTTASGLSQAQATRITEPNVPIDFVGFLPGTQDPEFSGEVEVEFAIYLTPTGGRPVWSEKQKLTVSKGRISTKLGTRTPIPWSLTIGNFKFASARIGEGPEVLPRMPIVNVVYSESSVMEKQIHAYSTSAVPERMPRTKASWSEALKNARKEGMRLPTYLEWYAAAAAGNLLSFSGHYEWTMPWVYDTASQGELNDQFRGRIQGCDYMDLDPAANAYVYRLCADNSKR